MAHPDSMDDAHLPDSDPDRLIDASNVDEPDDGPRPLGASSDPTLLYALLFDTLAVVALAVIGRASHSESLGLGDILSTAMPFLAGTYMTHLLVVRYFHPMAVASSGIAVAAGTWLVGMLGRLFLGQTNAPAFMAVSAAFLAVTIIGWRLARALLRKRSDDSRN